MKKYGKIINAIFNVIKIVAFAGIVILGVLFYMSGRVESDYNNAKAAVSKGDWNNALWFIEKIPHYKDATELYTYIYPNKIYSDKYVSAEETIKYYKSAVYYIETEKGSLKDTIDAKYVDELLGLEKVLNFKIAAFNAKAQDEVIKNNLTDSVNLVKQGNFDKAIEKLNGISDTGIYAPEKHQLLAFIDFQKSLNAKDDKSINQAIGRLNPTYGGEMSGEIKSAVLANTDMGKWTDTYNKANGIKPDMQAQDQQPQQPQPTNAQIKTGMKKEEVVTALGNPTSQNVISNKYGNFEDMVYNNNVHIYLEDNLVIGIKG